MSEISDEVVEVAAIAAFDAGWPTEGSRERALKNNPAILDGYRTIVHPALIAALPYIGKDGRGDNERQTP